MMNRTEILRQFAHMSGVGSVFFVITLGSLITGVGAILIAIGLFIFSCYVGYKQDIRKRLPLRIRKLEQLEDLVHDKINTAERGDDIRYKGAILYFLGIGVSLIVFPIEIGIVSIIVLSMGDSLSTLVGVHWGRHKTPVNPRKSWEGTLAGFLGSFLVCLFFINPFAAALASAVGMFMEAMPFPINDNLLMPFTVGMVLWIVVLVF